MLRSARIGVLVLACACAVRDLSALWIPLDSCCHFGAGGAMGLGFGVEGLGFQVLLGLEFRKS